MSKLFILNAFSLSMLTERAGTIAYVQMPVEAIKGVIASFCKNGGEVVSAVGHADTAAVFSSILGRPTQVNRISVALGEEDTAIVGQYSGPRLPEGTTTLPEGATITWFLLYLPKER